MADAGMIAQALGVTVEWLLSSAFRSDGDVRLKEPPNERELEAEAKAVERRIYESARNLNNATQMLRSAHRQMEEARQSVVMAETMHHQFAFEKTELEREYHYLLGRIDTMRAARGEPIESMEIRDGDD